LEDDNLIFKQPYKLSEVEKTLIKVQTTKLLDAGLVEMSKGEYASATMMPTKNTSKKTLFCNLSKAIMSFVTILVYFEYQNSHK
jgi:hypothetical protein